MMSNELAVFLEAKQLFTKEKGLRIAFESEFAKTKIQMHCEGCEGTRTFGFSNPSGRVERKAVESLIAGVPNETAIPTEIPFHAVYLCLSCNKTHYSFLLRFPPQRDFIEKVGQHPPPSADVSSKVKRALQEQAGNFRKGLVCEQQGYGIAAFAYYRRVLEERVVQLLDEVEALFSGPEKARYTEALQQVKEQHTAEDRLAIVKDFVPPALRAHGLNPLGVLYRSLSEGLHARADEECLKYAETIRLVLISTLEAIEAHKSTVTMVTERVRQLLDDK